jgi:hypothetical protein
LANEIGLSRSREARTGFQIALEVGSAMPALAAKLQNEGANSFVKSWNELLAVIVSKSANLQKVS